MTNVSGKFVTTGHSHYDESQKKPNVDADPNYQPPVYGDVIPPCPCTPATDTMEKVRYYFGRLWWLWLVVACICLTKN